MAKSLTCVLHRLSTASSLASQYPPPSNSRKASLDPISRSNVEQTDNRDVILFLSKSGISTITTFLNDLPSGVLSTLESTEEDAGKCVCSILDNYIPAAFDGVDATMRTQIHSDFSAVSSFIHEYLPSLGAAATSVVASECSAVTASTTSASPSAR